MIDRRKWKPLGPAFKAAAEAYVQSSKTRLLAADAHNAVTTPLYHYTDARGLEGIIRAQQVWLTHYQHLNDPSEMEFGMSVAKKTLAEVGTAHGQKVKIFCNMVADLLSNENLLNAIDFYIGSFSRNGDDLRQ